MWNAYGTKFEDRWTPSLLSVPRWMEAVQYPTLGQYVALPPVSGFVTTRSYTAPTTGHLPSSWSLTDSVPSTQGSVLQTLFESLTLQKQRFLVGLTSTALVGAKHFDVAEPDYAWIVTHSAPVHKLEVRQGGAWSEVERALGFSDLFMSGERRWLPDENQALIYGLDLQQVNTERRVDDWLFLSSASTWSSGSVAYVQQPTSKNWIPLHPLSVRADGLLYFSDTVTGAARVHFTTAVSGLSTVVVRVNGDQELTARRVALWNSLDARGLLAGVRRLDSEYNTAYAQALLVHGWFSGQTHEGLRNALSGHLRTGELRTLSFSASVLLPSDSTGFSVRNRPQYVYVRERLWPEPNNASSWFSSYADPELGMGFVNDQYVAHNSFSASSSFTFDQTLDNKTASAQAVWRLCQWTATASSLVFTDNTSSLDTDSVMYITKKVQVSEPGDRVRRICFLRTSPIYRWRSSSDLIETGIQGLAEFS